MKYSILVGNAELQVYEGSYEAVVKKAEQEDAPYWHYKKGQSLMEVDGRTNAIYFQHWMWSIGFSLPFDDLFLNRGGLVYKRPDVKPIKPEHLNIILEELNQYRENFPESKPGWMPGKDAVLARLIWFEWWFRWALENCENPAIWNY